MDFLQSPHEEETPVCLLDQSRILEGPREVLRDVDTQKLKPGDTFNLYLIDTGGDVRATFGLPEVHNELFGPLGVEGQVLDLLPVGQFIFVVDEANNHCIICKHDNSNGTMYRCAVTGEERVEERPEHTALRHTSVQGEG